MFINPSSNAPLFRKFSGLILLILFSAAARAGGLPHDVDGVQLFDNTKRNGGDYSNFTVGSVQECARACARDNACKSFNFGKEKKDCWLKNNVPAGQHNTTVISGVKGSKEKSKLPGEIAGIKIYDNTKRNGGDYSNFTVGSVDECARSCSRDNQCKSFNYGKAKKDCWLKNNVPGGENNNTVISGVKK